MAGVLILDGAMGTELARQGADTGLPLWSANALLNAPDLVRQIHRQYIEAGAQVITTNTFRTNVRTLARAGMRGQVTELTCRAVTLAREAIAEASALAKHRPSPPILVAGSIAPVEDCYSPELVPLDEGLLLQEHGELARNLAQAGCDLLLIETMNTVLEASAATHAAAATGLPVWVSLMLGPDNHLLGGESLSDALLVVLPYRPQALLLNCLPVSQVTSALTLLSRILREMAHAPVYGAYANAGHVGPAGWSMDHGVTPHEYTCAAREWAAMGAGIIGGCCGTTPEHIRALATQFIHE